ncbi:hypothetical protein, partial [Staphylococcus hominis]
GMTIYLTDGLYTIETVVLAKNNQGLKSLYQLSSAIMMKNKEEVPIEWLKKYDKHLIIIFKEAELSHKQIIDAFEGKKELYL